jgi:hypothetical protein
VQPARRRERREFAERSGRGDRRDEATVVLKWSVAEAREQGLRVCGDPGTEPVWEVSWNIEPYPLR